MAKKKKKTRAEPKEKRSGMSIGLVTDKVFDDLVCRGYTSLARSPEVSAGVDRIADLLGAMTIHLM